MKRILSTLIFAGTLMSCSDFLDAVPDRSLAILTRIEQYEQLLNYYELYTNAPSIADFGIDDYYLLDQYWQSRNIKARNAHVWAPDIYEGNNSSGVAQDWNIPYSAIYKTNVVLDGLERMTIADNHSLYNEVKGQALFVRAFQHYLLQEAFGQPFRPSSKDTDMGIPLRITSDLDVTVKRATVSETFEQIIKDLQAALQLFSRPYQIENKYWGSKAAVAAMLSRVYLTMQDYDRSKEYADSCLRHYDFLLHYGALEPTYKFPAPLQNPEILFEVTQGGTSGIFLGTNVFVDPKLAGLYDEYDLRQLVFMRMSNGNRHFNSFYSGTSSPFSGLATDEVYLNRAECNARLGNPQAAVNDLSHLLSHRYDANHVAEISPETPADRLLEIVLTERRKQLVLRGTRWTDLRRLNQDDRFAVSLTRILGDKRFTLPPNDRRYALPIPPREVLMSNFSQNQR